MVSIFRKMLKLCIAKAVKVQIEIGIGPGALKGGRGVENKKNLLENF